MAPVTVASLTRAVPVRVGVTSPPSSTSTLPLTSPVGNCTGSGPAKKDSTRGMMSMACTSWARRLTLPISPGLGCAGSPLAQAGAAGSTRACRNPGGSQARNSGLVVAASAFAERSDEPSSETLDFGGGSCTAPLISTRPPLTEVPLRVRSMRWVWRGTAAPALGSTPRSTRLMSPWPWMSAMAIWGRSGAPVP